ncbi:hypothetical protein AA313_de0205851 [Arthrobotrys entomopaga]|nr:hypothetical protein AA313_de0205851 [Arthrobotrys entomopaga]
MPTASIFIDNSGSGSDSPNTAAVRVELSYLNSLYPWVMSTTTNNPPPTTTAAPPPSTSTVYLAVFGQSDFDSAFETYWMDVIESNIQPASFDACSVSRWVQYLWDGPFAPTQISGLRSNGDTCSYSQLQDVDPVSLNDGEVIGTLDCGSAPSGTCTKQSFYYDCTNVLQIEFLLQCTRKFVH